MAGFNDLASAILQMNNQGNLASLGNNSARNLYPAMVTNVDDPTQQNRIQARIITLDNEGKIFGGKDRDKFNDNLPWCLPLMPEFFHVRPIPEQKDETGKVLVQGEMVWLILENPSDESAARYWMGPIISSQLKLKFQTYSEALKIADLTPFGVNLNTNNDFKVDALLPGPSDVAVQGRDDSDLILKPRQVILTAGKFLPSSITPNTKNPSTIKLIQFDNNQTGPLTSYSQANINSTNINIYSPIGKFREKSMEKFEKSENLKSFGELAASLHPAVFGDELVKLLDLLIKVVLTHIHTPQSPLVTTPQSIDLQSYNIEGKLQNLISNVVRIN